MCIAVEKNRDFPGVIREPERETPLRGSFDVVVAGGGPAGVCAAISAAKNGASVLLLENEGCLGGILTSGLMSNIIDAENKGGLLREILDELAAMGMVRGHYSSVDPEAMKYCIEKRVLHAGICVRLYTRVVAAVVSPEGRIRAVVTESASGREAWSGKIFVDATGNGDLSALAGCKYEFGNL